jgi:hypothetical protein
MIETTTEACSAISEIQHLTGWTIERIGDKAGVNAFVIRRVLSGEVRNTNQKNLNKIGKLYDRIKEKFENA